MRCSCLFVEKSEQKRHFRFTFYFLMLITLNTAGLKINEQFKSLKSFHLKKLPIQNISN